MDRPSDLPDDELLRLCREAAKLPDAPATWIARAAAIGAPAVAPWPTRAAAAIRHLVAVLAFDSFAVPPPALGLRSAADPTRRLLFSAGERTIDIRIAGHGARIALSGQLIGDDEGGRVELVDGSSDDARTAPLDEQGGFGFGDLPAGVLRLTLQLGTDRIALPPIDAGRAAR